MIVFLKLTTAGVDSGPFDLYSNLDAYSEPFEENVSRASLIAGYSTDVPDYATTVRITSKEDCISSVDITLRDVECDLEGYTGEITTSTSTSTTTATPDIAPGVALTWTADNGPFTSIVFQITRKRAGVETVVSQKTLNNGNYPDPSGNYNGGAGSTFYSQQNPLAQDAQLSVEGYFQYPVPSGLQTGDEIRIYLATTNISSQSNGGPVGSNVQSTLILRRTLRTVYSYSTIDTQSDSGPSPSTAYIPIPPGAWYTVDPLTYIYEVIAITEISS